MKIVIDNTEIDVPDHYTLMEACEEAGVEIPRFCFHKRLSIAGNCRMCLVEVKGGPPKPQASCALGVRDCRPGPNGEPPVVLTRSAMVKKAREGVMEFLLINHPLDCPICDQGGECDLQDQAMAYGIDKNRFGENKRAVEDKYIGPLVRTKMTRCIHCTRCVRFATEIAGIPELGLIGRGEDAEITTYLEHAMTSEMQGNIIDLCPVGALTSRPYQDRARPWELIKTASIDVMDALGSNIRLDSRDRRVMRIKPRENEAVNEEWISDKTRFVWDGLSTQRLDCPYVRKRGKLQPVSWQEAFAAIAAKIRKTKPEHIGAIAGDLAGVEDMFALKSLMQSLKSGNYDCRSIYSALEPSRGRASYIFNSTIEGIETADALAIIGANPRKEAAILNSRIYRRWRRGNFPITLIGEKADLRYDYVHLGHGSEALKTMISHPQENARNPMFIIGEGALDHSAGASILALAAKAAHSAGAIRDDWNGFNILHNAAARVGGLDIGFVPEKGGKTTAEMLGMGDKKKNVDVLFALGFDEPEITSSKGFVIYVGTHGDVGAHRADIILPACAYTEKSAIYVNMEGRVQMTERAVFPPGDAKEDWTIFRALSALLGKVLPFDNLKQLREKLYNDVPHLAHINTIEPGSHEDIVRLSKNSTPIDRESFTSSVDNFYLTNPIARASAVMAQCSQLHSKTKQQVVL